MSKARGKGRERGELAFGTVDTFLLWRLTGGKVHATDITNASRTLLCNIDSGDWDDDLLKLLRVPRALLPEIKQCSDDFGSHRSGLFGAAIPLRGIAGDQQAATIGQACFEPGMLKSTYGTGCFALLNTGATRVASSQRLLTTIAYRIKGETAYALEGSIFVAGAAVQWLRDGLHLIARAEESGVVGGGRRSGADGLSGARFHRAGRALVGRACPGRDVRAHPQYRAARIRPRRAGRRLLPDP